jgi:alpha-beta hydrolase superfamily lysophospholipase
MDPIPDVPIDPAMLSRDPSVGAAYAADELVYHGPFRRDTLRAIGASVAAIAAGPGLGALPTLWVHGELDQLAPLEVTRGAVQRLRASDLTEHVYPGAQHEVFNEINGEQVIDDVVAFLHTVV